MTAERRLHHDERLTVPATWWLLGALATVMVSSVVWVAVPTTTALVAGGACGGVVAYALLRFGSLRVRVDDVGLHAGRAHLPWAYVGEVAGLDAEQTRLALGRDADARAFLVVRPYCREAVRVAVQDVIDPVPYWVISSRHADQLVKALDRASVQD